MHHIIRNTMIFIILTSFILSVPIMAADNIPASKKPPKNLNVKNVPMFVLFGWDDNNMEDAMLWIVNFMKDKKNPSSSSNNPKTFDGLPAVHTFLNVGAGWLDTAWSMAFNAGHEIGCHTLCHNAVDNETEFCKTGTNSTAQEWKEDILETIDSLTAWINNYNKQEKIDKEFKKEYIKGFRTPSLVYDDNTFKGIVDSKYILFDCSIESSDNSAEAYWPYTLDAGPAPGALAKITQKYPGLWEFQVNTINGTTGFDYNFFQGGGNGQAYYEWIKSDFDKRYNGNRAPMLVNAHTDNFSPKNVPASGKDRQKGVEDFVTYVLSKPETRMVRFSDYIEWARNPIELNATPIHVKNTIASGMTLTITPANDISFSLPKAGTFTLDLYSTSGKKVGTIQSGFLASGTHTYSIHRNAVPSGMYVVSLKGENTTAFARISIVNSK
ncbi:MAG: hypothetical protein JW795_18415 [Chitinivibrionales bacterium]|nr:hypothetical protein [Chitinivibrionales bacterium]